MQMHGFFLSFSGCYRKRTNEIFSSNYTDYQLVLKYNNFFYPTMWDNFVPSMWDNEIFKPIKEQISSNRVIVFSPLLILNGSSQVGGSKSPSEMMGFFMPCFY